MRSRKQNQAKPKMEMSKKLLIVSDVISSVTVVLTFIAVFTMKNVSPLAYLIPGVFGLSSVAHGFYYWKAKAENLHKFGQDNKITMSGGDPDPDSYPGAGADMMADDYSGSDDIDDGSFG